MHSLAFEDEPCWMSKIIQHFSKHCSCHFLDEYVKVGHFWKQYTEKAVDGMSIWIWWCWSVEWKMETAMFAEKLDSFQHSTWITPKSRSCALISSHENPRITAPNTVLSRGFLKSLGTNIFCVKWFFWALSIVQIIKSYNHSVLKAQYCFCHHVQKRKEDR
jgi:hypothetical protein